MALLQCTFLSDTLGLMTEITVVLPESPVPDTPCLYLLHGLSDDHSVWHRRTSVERYATESGIAVIMPSCGRSFYANMTGGGNYWTYISEELPKRVKAFFPITKDREQTFVAGNSMGGYGAFKLALRFPDRYAAAASLSGVLDLARWVKTQPNRFNPDLEYIFGPHADITGSGDDLMACAAELHRNDLHPKPRLYQWCGTQDFLYSDNVRFREHAHSTGLNLTYEESSGGHDWGLWDRRICQVLQWFTK